MLNNCVGVLNMKLQSIKSTKQMKKFIDFVLKQYPAQSDKIISRALEINQQICNENPNQSREVLVHTKRRIYPAISVYKAILENTGNKERAYRTIEDCFNHDAKKAGRILRMLCKIPFSYKFVPKIMRRIIHKSFGKKAGFNRIDYPNEKGKCHIDMIECPYFNNCVKYECTELSTVFCNTDDISYGNMHDKLFWGRTKTLARGNDCCDFILEIKKTGNIQ